MLVLITPLMTLHMMLKLRGSAADDVNVGQQSNMYDRMKSQPRKRIKSHAIRTPFAGLGTRRKMKILTMSLICF